MLLAYVPDNYQTSAPPRPTKGTEGAGEILTNSCLDTLRPEPTSQQMHEIPSGVCWLCGGGEKRIRHLDCKARAPQIKAPWKDVGKACGQKHPPSSNRQDVLPRGGDNPMMPSFLRGTQVGTS